MLRCLRACSRSSNFASMNRFCLIVMSLLLLVSCQQVDDSQHFTAKVYRGDFRQYLQVQGTVVPSKTISVTCIPELRWSMIQWVVDDGVYVQEGDVICVLDNTYYEGLREEISLQVEQGRLSYESGVARLQSQYAELEAQAKNNAIQARLSQLDSLQLAYYSPNQKKIAELNLRKNAIQQAKLDRQLATMKVVNEAELKSLEMQLRQNEELEETYARVMDNTIIKAPASGMMLLVNCPAMPSRKLMSGDEMRQDVGKIVLGDERQVKIEAVEQDVKRIEAGQQVEFTFPGLPAVKAYGSILSKAPVSRPIVQGSTLNVFDVTAQIDSATAVLDPEISANCQVCLRSIPDTLLVPVVALFDEDSARVVYARQGKYYVRKAVEVVAQSDFEAVVASGLQEGETLSLVKPQENKILKIE